MKIILAAMLPVTELAGLLVVVILVVAVYGFVKTMPKRKSDDE